jgi:ABC-2 type transport system permease protein
MSVSSQSIGARRPSAIAGELAKLGAFVRRDILIGISYRTAFASAIGGLALQVLVLSWIGKLIEPKSLPEFGGVHVSYMAFVTIGLAVNLAGATLLYRVATQLRNEQLIGTLEALLCTPTAIWTLQVGTAVGSLLAIPLRMGLFLGVLALAFGLHFDASGFLPAAVLTVAFIPCLWGIGLALAGAILTFRRGHGVTTLGTAALSLTSGAFFPLTVLPHWLASIAAVNPISISCLLLGAVAFRLALARERRKGTLGAY